MTTPKSTRPSSRTSKGKTQLSPRMSLIGNVAMFFIAAIICFGLMRGFRGWVATAGEPAGYMLVTTRPVQSGEPLSSANAQWAPVKGKKPAGVIMAMDKRTPVEGYVAIIRLAADKPVKISLVAKEQNAVVRTEEGLTGFVLSQDDLGSLAPFLKGGDYVDIIAIKGAGKGADAESGALSVATVVSSAEITGLIKPVSVGRAGRQGAAVIGVTSDQARILGLLRQVAKLEVVLSPARPRGARPSNDPFIPWQNADELGFTPNFSKDVEFESAPASIPVGAGTSLEAAQKPQFTVAVITPSGTTQTVVPN